MWVTCSRIVRFFGNIKISQCYPEAFFGSNQHWKAHLFKSPAILRIAPDALPLHSIWYESYWKLPLFVDGLGGRRRVRISLDIYGRWLFRVPQYRSNLDSNTPNSAATSSTVLVSHNSCLPELTVSGEFSGNTVLRLRKLFTAFLWCGAPGCKSNFNKLNHDGRWHATFQVSECLQRGRV